MVIFLIFCALSNSAIKNTFHFHFKYQIDDSVPQLFETLNIQPETTLRRNNAKRGIIRHHDAQKVILVERMQLSIFAITIIPRTPGIGTKHFSPPLGFCIQDFSRGGGDLLGQLLTGGHLSVNDVCHFWNFHYNGKNCRLITLCGLLIALTFCTFLKKIIQS